MDDLKFVIVRASAARPYRNWIQKIIRHMKTAYTYSIRKKYIVMKGYFGEHSRLFFPALQKVIGLLN